MSSNKEKRRSDGAQLKRQAATKLKRELRRTHIKNQGGKCATCQKPLDFERSALMHKTGDANTLENTRAVHVGCVPA